ncbi:LysR family transcriptional regulator [Lutibaculum baratangense]|uniref:Transcriptional regulator, LysR family n=1 Tax=Lutibaculum baratangense AMV1 TaxID=631454 RepID=V4RFH9_9HYPH|nr:LysR family transcriptional regulator [Lutibaculum baratangense]ESR24886.1 transcriptional regulator, LysR family [Lutibaculum baratangense AMV1]
MRLEWLEDILAVLETGSLAAAAERRCVTQPAFSRRIMAIEAHLGVELIERARKPSRPKPALRDQRERIHELAAGLRDLRNDLQRHDRETQNSLVISCQHAITTSVAPTLVRGLGGEPHLNVRLRSGNREECFAQLVTRQADIALLYQTHREPLAGADDYVELIELGPEPLLPVFPTRRLDELAAARTAGGIPVVAYPADVFLGKVTRQEIFPDLELLVHPRAETALTPAIKELVCAGVGVGWLPRSLVAAELRAGVLQDLSGDLPSCTMTIAAMRLRTNRLASVERVWRAVGEFRAGE